MDRSSTIEIIFKAIDKSSPVIKNIWSGLSRVGRIGLGGAVAGLAAVSIGVATLGYGIQQTTTLAREQIRVEKQLDTVLASTGNAVGLTADHLKRYASELQRSTNYGDEAIIGAENMLLTFTNVQGQIYERALPTILDLSAAMGQDLKTSAIQVGKALNDPIAGLGSLSRVGIQFTDTQKQQIEQMTRVNDLAGAQGIILEELARQFGGSAEAQANPLIQLNNLWGDFQEEVGKGVLPILDDLAQRAMPLVVEQTENVRQKVATVSPTFQSAFSNLLSGDQEAALHDLQLGLMQLGFEPDQVESISESATRIGESFSRIWGSVQQIDPDSIFTIIEGLVKIVEGIAWVGEQISDAIQVAKGLADSYEQVKSVLGEASFAEGAKAIGEAVSAEYRTPARESQYTGAGAMTNFMQGMGTTAEPPQVQVQNQLDIQPQTVTVAIDGDAVGSAVAKYILGAQRSQAAVPHSGL